jgi:hypothetical protein
MVTLQKFRSARSASCHIYGHWAKNPIGKECEWSYIWPLVNEPDRQKVAVAIYMSTGQISERPKVAVAIYMATDNFGTE